MKKGLFIDVDYDYTNDDSFDVNPPKKLE